MFGDILDMTGGVLDMTGGASTWVNVLLGIVILYVVIAVLFYIYILYMLSATGILAFAGPKQYWDGFLVSLTWGWTLIKYIFGMNGKNSGSSSGSKDDYNWRDSYDNIVSYPGGLSQLKEGSNAVTNIASVLNGSYEMNFKVRANTSGVNPHVLKVIQNGRYMFDSVPDVNVDGEKLSIICGEGDSMTSHKENIGQWKNINVKKMGNSVTVKSGMQTLCTYTVGTAVPADAYLHVFGYGHVIKDLSISGI